jgi:hypothetical protein
MVDRRALRQRSHRIRIESQRLVEISECAIKIAFCPIGGAPIHVGRNLIALGFPPPTLDEPRATYDPRI